MRNHWDDFVELSQLASYPITEHPAAFRMTLDPTMQQVVVVVLNITPVTITTPDQVLDRVADYVRAKRNLAIEERRQGPSESFDEFYIGLLRLVDVTDLCATCAETRLVTRIISGTRDEELETRKVKMISHQFFSSLTNGG